MPILTKGDILEVRSLGYAHYAIVVDYGNVNDKVTVVHVQGDDGQKANKSARVIEEVYLKFLVAYHAGLMLRANELDNTYQPYSSDEIVRRARSKGPVRAGVGLHSTAGIRSQNDSDGFRKAIVAETKYAQVDVGRARATVGASVTTGVTASADGIGVQVLGTGYQIGRETKISYFGNSIGIRWW
uniref:Uncharacterized protein n=1 Tax=Panagrolaimus sp. ES5 TaxID=591445 RepID=A0AC34GV21_9BILA